MHSLSLIFTLEKLSAFKKLFSSVIFTVIQKNVSLKKIKLSQWRYFVTSPQRRKIMLLKILLFTVHRNSPEKKRQLLTPILRLLASLYSYRVVKVYTLFSWCFLSALPYSGDCLIWSNVSVASNSRHTSTRFRISSGLCPRIPLL